jgi:hypothetical protein
VSLVNILVVLPPKQFIHPLWASHFANIQLQSKVTTCYVA